MGAADDSSSCSSMASTDLSNSSSSSGSGSTNNPSVQQQHLWHLAQQGELLETYRPDRISISVPASQIPSLVLWNCFQKNNDDKVITYRGMMIQQNNNEQEDELDVSSRDETLHTTLLNALRQGDVLEMVNREKLQCTNLRELQDYLLSLTSLEDGDSVHLQFQTNNNDTTTSPTSPSICHAISLVASINDDNEQQSDGIVLKEHSKNKQQFVIGTAGKRFEHSVLSPDQILLYVGHEQPTNNITQLDQLTDAQFCLDMLQSQPQVHVVTMTPVVTWQQRARKASIAVGGGTMVGVGAVMMATPLHPLGHAMAFGGAGVLSTEFEGPRNFLNSMRWRVSSKSETNSPTRGAATNAPNDKQESTEETTETKDAPSEETSQVTSAFTARV